MLNRVFILGLLLATSAPAIAQEVNHEPILVADSQSVSPYGWSVFYFSQSGETLRGMADCNKDLVEYRVQIESGDWILNEVKESAEYLMLATACNLDEY
ncbi:hypothetical protein [Nostoc sp. FACHB-888]|uniref:hypothetical protein n=1 Tax=Nostoc sp. FACHB-888 TaxID=2692842 RepID=UPI001689453E|nr:hypothetical protein [Nostoc sp. FACHB-888]MBD2245126.1 hypothetical protein [Nostoc sp. FACHB-888]